MRSEEGEEEGKGEEGQRRMREGQREVKDKEKKEKRRKEEGGEEERRRRKIRKTERGLIDG